MKRVTVRLDTEVHQRLQTELVEWRKIRGPKFSLNDLCSEKLSYALPPTQWVTTGTFAGTNNNVVVFTSKKNPAAVALGKLGGRVGGKAGAEKLTPEQRRKITSDATRVRWERERAKQYEGDEGN
jgi:hypothetical protein